MYYIISEDPMLTRASVHLGLHDHPVAKGDSRQDVETAKVLISDATQKHLGQSPSFIGLQAAHELIFKKIIKDPKMQESMMTTDDPWLLEMFEAVSHVSSPAYVRNMVHVTRAALGKQCDISSILKLKSRSTYDFIHEIMLPGMSMHGQKACLFKMSPQVQAVVLTS